MPKGRSTQIFTTTLLLALAGTPAAAQTSGMPADIEAKVAALGAVINPPATAKLYAPLQEKEPYKGVKATRDLKYGPNERHALDLFVPEATGAAPRPVLMFVHGGAFIGGSRRRPDSPYYDNVMLFAARNGMVGVNTTYRLAPQNPWPAGAQDVGTAVRWVNENIAAHGAEIPGGYS